MMFSKLFWASLNMADITVAVTANSSKSTLETLETLTSCSLA